MRTRLQDKMIMLRKTFREALKEDELQEAFDELWPTWANEQAAMIFTEVLSALDLLILTAAVDNRRGIMKLKQALDLDSP
jgi:hypothetical protein